MGPTNEGDDRGRFRRHVRSADFQVIRSIAEKMRSEFGDSIDAHPGGIHVEAGAINRAFRMAAWVILKEADSLEDEPSVQSWVMRQTALGRLLEVGVIGTLAEALLDLEPCLGDASLAYMALGPGIRDRRTDEARSEQLKRLISSVRDQDLRSFGLDLSPDSSESIGISLYVSGTAPG